MTVASSTCQAEFMALSIAVRQLLGIRHLLMDMFKKEYTISLKCDNQSAIHVATNDSSNKRCRHVERDFFAINEALYEKKAKGTWIPTVGQWADILTKNLSPDCFGRLSALVLNNPG